MTRQTNQDSSYSGLAYLGLLLLFFLGSITIIPWVIQIVGIWLRGLEWQIAKTCLIVGYGLLYFAALYWLEENRKDADKRFGFLRYLAHGSRNAILSLWLFWLISGVGGVLPKTITIEGDTMGPSFQSGDRLLWTSAAYMQPARGDIVVVDLGAGNSFLGRVVGLPGETVEFRAGRLLVNGQWLSESYLDQNSAQLSTPPHRLISSTYWVLPDRRTGEQERGGVIRGEAILGRVVLRTGPLARFGILPTVQYINLSDLAEATLPSTPSPAPAPVTTPTDYPVSPPTATILASNPYPVAPRATPRSALTGVVVVGVMNVVCILVYSPRRSWRFAKECWPIVVGVNATLLIYGLWAWPAVGTRLSILQWVIVAGVWILSWVICLAVLNTTKNPYLTVLWWLAVVVAFLPFLPYMAIYFPLQYVQKSFSTGRSGPNDSLGQE